MEQKNIFDDLIDYNAVKDKLIIRLVPERDFDPSFSDIINERIGDIVVTYRVITNSDRAFFGSIPVTTDVFFKYGISLQELRDDAIHSMMKMRPTVQKLTDFLQITGNNDDDRSGLYVATLEDAPYGASVTQINSIMDGFAATIGKNFFVLPSSQHECLFLADDGSFEVNILESIVRSINGNSDLLSPKNFLSNSVYYYDKHTREFTRYRDRK